MKKKLSRKKLYLYFLFAFIVVLASFFTYSLVTGNFSFATNVIGWDGTSVASSFGGGNGEVENPYQISNAEEFMYFKELIEGDSFSAFQGSHFSLTSDIDFGGNYITPIGVSVDGVERIFNGTFDGNGYTLSNFKIDTPSVVSDKEYYSLFSKINDASIINLNINDFNIKLGDTDFGSILVGEIASSKDGLNNEENTLDASPKEELSIVKNISISDFFIELSDSNVNSNTINVISDSISVYALIKNIYLKGTYKGDNYNIDVVPENSNISNVLFDVIYSGSLKNDIDSLYIINDDKIYANDVEISSTSLLSLFNENNDGEFSWVIEDNKYVYRKNISSIVEMVSSTSMMFALSSRAGDIPVYESGFSSDKSVIYINDLDSDLNYYESLNYIDYTRTTSNPDNFGTNMNYYSKGINLVEVHIEYDGHDYDDDSIYGMVSIDEKTTNFVYYNYYPVENGYVEIELIDNPYANRPNDLYFNGWGTDYRGAEIYYRSEDYVRYVRIPVSDAAQPINIIFHALWTNSGTTGTTSNYKNVIDSFPSVGMTSIKNTCVEMKNIYSYSRDIVGLYYSGTVSRYNEYPDGVLDEDGNKASGICNTNGGCTYYVPITEDNKDYVINTFFTSNTASFYTFVNYWDYIKYWDEVRVTRTVESSSCNRYFFDDKKIEGYYRKIISGSSSSGKYYDSTGKTTTSSCSTKNPCYELIQHYDSNGNVNIYKSSDDIYMLTTRDTNIMVLNSDMTNNNTNYRINTTKPFTLTGINNGSNVGEDNYLSGAYQLNNNADFRVEFITIRGTNDLVNGETGLPSTQTRSISGNWYNLKVGRGIKKGSYRFSSINVYAGGTGSSGNSSKDYGSKRMIIESGYYNFGVSTNYTGNSTSNVTAIWGNDYDRVSKNNSNLDIYHSILGAIDGKVDSSSKSQISIKNIVKSGNIGSGGNIYTYGIYVAARGSATMRSVAEVVVEGGKVNNIIGGPYSAKRVSGVSVTNDVDIYVFIKGGEANAVFGGAGKSPTYGSKVISITGGKVNYSVYGGSNGYSGSSTDGKVYGDSYIYIGGNAIIGDESLKSSNSTLYDRTIEVGNVFGHGNGKSGSSNTGIGPMENSNILINGGRILNNVYGGSNYGAAGISNSTTSHIIVKNGQIDGNIFGSGNNNGSGSSSVTSNNIIDVSGGTIGNIYGGANSKGSDYGTSLINISGGTVLGDVFGGGYGNPTYVRNNVDINISGSTTRIKGNVYGGSALGTTNKLSSGSVGGNTIVTINDGIVDGAVFGGGMGNSTYTPHVYGNISVTVNNGSIGEVYGGFDVKGNPENGKTDTVVVNNGTINNVYGGGRKASDQQLTDVTINNGTIKESVYGGSNTSGTVTNSNVKVNGGTINDSIYGGGNNVGVSDTTNVLYANATASNVYGGSNKNGNSKKSIVVINSGTVSNSVYGGNNVAGNVLTPTIEVKDGLIGSVYGGGNQANSGSSSVLIKGGTINDVFGGGNSAGLYKVNGSNTGLSADLGDSLVNITGGSINRVFGGSNNKGDINTSNIDVSMGTNGGISSDDILVTSNVTRSTLLEDWQKNNDVLENMKYFVAVDVIVQNKSGKTFEDLKLNLDYSESVFMRNYSLMTTDIPSYTLGTSAVMSKYMSKDLTMSNSNNNYLYFQFEMATNVDPSEFSFGATISQGETNSINELYGGNNAGGTVTSTIINANSSSINYVYGGGNDAPVTSSKVTLTKINGINAFGGNNSSKTTSDSYIEVNNSNFKNLYGGGNNAPNGPSQVIVNDGKYNSVFGGGNAAESGNSKVTINAGTINDVFGGGNSAGLSNDSGGCSSTLNIKGGTISNVYGGSNEKGTLKESNVNINIDATKIPSGTPYTKKLAMDISTSKQAITDEMRESNPDLFEGKNTLATVTVNLRNLTNVDIFDWAILLNIPEVEVYKNDDYWIKPVVDSTNGSLLRANSSTQSPWNTYVPANGSRTFSFQVLSDASLNEFTAVGEVTDPGDIVIVPSQFNISNVYGGGNKGNADGHVESTKVNILSGRVVYAFGGGNAATVGKTNVVVNGGVLSDVYGGGNMASVNDSTNLDIDSATIYSNVYGGGNEGSVINNTTVYITDTVVQGNAFGGGNGKAAIVYGDSNITIDGTTEVGTDESIAPNSGCVFASGNAADNGNDADPALGIAKKEGNSNVNLVGGIVHGNVYGGAKMAVVYGEAKVNIGTNAVVERTLNENNIHILGSVFGGGESNASGGASYDGGAISVYKGINVNINGANYIKNNHDFIINGSIFGSGNASSSKGESKIDIKYLGSKEKPNQAISIQRSSDLTIDSSFIELSGAKDRTNEDATARELFTFHHVDILKLINNSSLLLRNSANALKEFYSGVYKNGVLTPATVEIDDDTKKVTKNVDNRLYILTREHLQVFTTPGIVDTYGKVTGMTFFGMYTGGSSGYNYGVYDSNYSYGDKGDGSLVIAGGSYITGLQQENHDITVDGFYSNYLDEETFTDISTAYVVPTAPDPTGYMWSIGIPVDEYEVVLQASKLSSAGTNSLSLLNLNSGNTTFTVLGFDASGLNAGINLMDYTEIPRVGETIEEANNTFGLVMKSETQEWTSKGVTKFTLDGFSGDTVYKTDSRNITPSLMFYLYHPKNIDLEDQELGYCTITLQSITPSANKLEFITRFITITVYLDAVKSEVIPGYDAAITYDKKYELPVSTSVNITNRSQFSAYFSLAEFYDSYDKVYGENYEYFHVLSTDEALPVNTMITMIDYSANKNRPDYYYLKITPEIYNETIENLDKNNEADYPLSKFIKMDSVSSNNTYNDYEANKVYYNEKNKIAVEEFVFIVDFKETTTTGQHLNNNIYFELRKPDNYYHLKIQRNDNLMFYSTYDTSNATLNQDFSTEPTYLYYDIPFSYDYNTGIIYDIMGEQRVSVIDTNYESSKMGVNISFVDDNGENISSSLLVGTSIILDGVQYFSDGDGVFRIKLADKVSSIEKEAQIIVNKDLPAGDYILRYTLFASDDGLHNSTFENSVTKEFSVHVVSADNYISVESDDKEQIVDGDTSLNLNGTNINKYSVKFSSKLSNQNFRIYVYKRNIDDADTNNFEIVPFNDLFKNKYNATSDGGVYINVLNYRVNEFKLELNDELTSGTYRISFEMYDNNQLIDQDVKYVIVKKKVE